MRSFAARSLVWPRAVLLLAGGFWLLSLLIQIWRLESLSATYDQALFLQELWATAQGRPFESSLSSVLSGAVAQLVARVVRDDEVAGSNPVTPTRKPLLPVALFIHPKSRFRPR